MAFLKLIEGFPNYAINRVGQVINVKTGLVLKARLAKNGYMQVCLCHDGTVSTRTIHRLILEAFVGPAPAGYVGCHNNGIRDDNRLENLRWDSQSGNLADRILHGTANRGSKHPRAKLTETGVDQIRSMLSQGILQRDIAAEFGLRQCTISAIKLGRTWSHHIPSITS